MPKKVSETYWEIGGPKSGPFSFLMLFENLFNLFFAHIEHMLNAGVVDHEVDIDLVEKELLGFIQYRLGIEAKFIAVADLF